MSPQFSFTSMRHRERRSRRVLPVLILAAVCPAMSPAAETLITNFEGFAVGNEVVFQEPRLSGSTSTKLELTPNTSAVTATFPAGLVNSGGFVYYTNFSFAAVADPLWVRLTTFNTPNLPNPVISFTQPLRFDIYSDRALYVALGLRETNSAGPIGSNGGGTGPNRIRRRVDQQFCDAAARTAHPCEHMDKRRVQHSGRTSAWFHRERDSRIHDRLWSFRATGLARRTGRRPGAGSLQRLHR